MEGSDSDLTGKGLKESLPVFCAGEIKPKETAHAGSHDLRMKRVYAIRTEPHGSNTKPFGKA